MFEQEQPDKLVVSDIPLLYESGLSEQFDQVMVVYVPAEIQLKRLMERDGISEADALSRLNAQMDIEEKKRRADIVIDNSGTVEETKAQIIKFWHDKGLS